MRSGKLTAVALTLGALAATGCAAVDVARDRLGDRAESVVDSYCSLPRSARAVVRVETNRAIEERGQIVIGCKGEPDYERLRTAFVEPLSDATFDRLLTRLLTDGALTLPDGTKLRVVVSEGE